MPLVRFPTRARVPVALAAPRALVAAAAFTAVLALASCSGGAKDEQAAARPAMTEAHRDSLIATSRIPGAAGVARALVVADSARARVNRPIPGTP
jgi:hypothetical protein